MSIGREGVMTGTIRRRSLGAALAAGAASRPALAQPAWPTRPISLIVTYAPGGSADLLARLIAVEVTPVASSPSATLSSAQFIDAYCAGSTDLIEPQPASKGKPSRNALARGLGAIAFMATG